MESSVVRLLQKVVNVTAKLKSIVNIMEKLIFTSVPSLCDKVHYQGISYCLKKPYIIGTVN